MPVEQLREKIDGVDDRIVELVEKRVELAKKIGQVKRKKGLPLHDPEREEELLGRLTGKTRLSKDFIRKLYREIVTYCRENE